jgi:hypothetical protein
MKLSFAYRLITLGIFLLGEGMLYAQGQIDSLRYPLLYGRDDGMFDMNRMQPVSPPRYVTLTVDPDVEAIWRRSPKVTSFFCRTELLIERKSILAPRFRLGSLDYTEWMEGKLKTKN